jgi:hypothetical protein
MSSKLNDTYNNTFDKAYFKNQQLDGFKLDAKRDIFFQE